MQVKCEYCGSFIDDQAEQCPNCGAPNSQIHRYSDGVPKTIEELQAYCVKNNVPVAQMHFHIGEDYRGPKAFGIYREDSMNVVVYKNKSDGSRTIRYRGNDEAYAVNEIYQKMRSEYANHKAYNTSNTQNRGSRPSGANNSRRRGRRKLPFWLIIVLSFLVIGSICLFIDDKINGRTGYYTYEDTTYYNDGGSWYYWNGSSWNYANRFADDIDDYYSGDQYDSSYYDSDMDFTDSSYYEENHSYDDDSGYDSSDSYDSYDSDWDSWDSGSDWDWDSGSDWDSDW